MATAITIPRLGWNMDHGIFVGWLKREGEAIRAGDPLFTLEGEKAAQDIEANEPGILRIAPTAPAAGAVVAVGTVIGHLLGPGESAAIAEEVAPIERPQPAHAVVAGGVSSAVNGAEARGRGSSRRGDRPRISPLARRVARELGVDWTRLVGSGCTGRIRKVDVLTAARTADTRSAAGFVPIGPTRRTIAARMVQSRQATTPVTLHATADATNLVSLRAQYKAAAPPGARSPASWNSSSSWPR